MTIINWLKNQEFPLRVKLWTMGKPSTRQLWHKWFV